MDNQWTAAPDPYYQVSEYLRSNLGFNIWKYSSQRCSTCPMIPNKARSVSWAQICEWCRCSKLIPRNFFISLRVSLYFPVLWWALLCLVSSKSYEKSTLSRMEKNRIQNKQTNKHSDQNISAPESQPFSPSHLLWLLLSFSFRPKCLLAALPYLDSVRKAL